MSKERIALCFFGQPRGFEKNFEIVSNFISNNYKNYEVDIFIHTWWDESLIGEYYACSPWRQIPLDELLIRGDTIERINELYKPKKIMYEKPNDFKEEVEKIKIMELYNNIYYYEPLKKVNITNIISNLYSKYKVSELFKKYIDETGVQYKIVSSLRFDLNHGLKNFDPDNCIPNKLYQYYRKSEVWPPKRIDILDQLLFFTNTEYFLNYSKTYINIQKINNSIECKLSAKIMNLNFEFNAEEMITFNMSLYYTIDELVDMFIFIE